MRSSIAKVVSSAATQVAKRGSPSIMDISPRVLPVPTEATSFGFGPSNCLNTFTWPLSTTTMKLPSSPSKMKGVPVCTRKSSRKPAQELRLLGREIAEDARAAQTAAQFFGERKTAAEMVQALDVAAADGIPFTCSWLEGCPSAGRAVRFPRTVRRRPATFAPTPRDAGRRRARSRRPAENAAAPSRAAPAVRRTSAFGRVRVEVDQHHVRAGDHALRGDVEDVEQPVRRLRRACRPSATGRRTPACASGAAPPARGRSRRSCGAGRPCWSSCRAGRTRRVRLPSLARYSAAFSDSSSVMPKPRLSRTGKSFWRPTILSSSKFCVLRVPIWSMTPVGLPVSLQRVADLVDVRLVGDLHRDHLDAVLARPARTRRAGSPCRAPGTRTGWCAACTRPCACRPARARGARASSARRARACRPRTGRRRR